MIPRLIRNSVGKTGMKAIEDDIRKCKENNIQEIKKKKYIFCSWCQKVFDKETKMQVAGIEFDLAKSHGMCDECKIKVKKGII